MSVEKAVQYALAQVGKPYVWGTEGPDTFDCSGLVYAAFRHAGFKVSRVTYTQIRDGSPVSRDNMARGDLWFTDPGHVAIYLGDGMMVEAPNAQSRVRVVPVRAFYAGRRIGTPSTGNGAVPGPGTGSGISFENPLSDITEALDTLTDPHLWVRVLTMLSGGALIAMLVWSVTKG